MSNLVSIHKNAKIGKNTIIGNFSTIEEDVIIGDNCYIDSNVTIKNGSRIGNNVKIFPGAVVSAIPQDLKFDGEITQAIIKDNSTIRECVTVNRGTKASGKTIVGKNVLLMAYSHVAHDCIIYDNVVIANSVQLAGHVEIGSGAVIGGLVGVQQFVKIGKNVMVQGGTLVGKDVPPYIRCVKFPVRYNGINRIGLQRHGFSVKDINQISEIYKFFYTTTKSIPSSLEYIEEKFKNSIPKKEIIKFISNCSRQGVMKKSSFNNEINV